MKQIASVLALLVAFSLPVRAQDMLASRSADEILPGCTRYLAALDGQGDFTDTLADSRQDGFCVGSVVGITETLLRTRFACQPQKRQLGHVQAIRIVVDYLNDIPNRMDEPFNSLAIEALTHAWPCVKPR
jgi:hypothetical protein